MGKLHELLAVEKTKLTQTNGLLQETAQKFNKMDFFVGFNKTLSMIEATPQNSQTELAARETRNMPTTVQETLEYVLKFWAETEDVLYQKNQTNRVAASSINFRGTEIAKDVSVDELLGLEARLETLRKIMQAMPTLPASQEWRPDPHSDRKGSWRAVHPEIKTKTEKVMVPVILYEATPQHPAQVKEATSDKTVGTFKTETICGAATSAQKAEVITIIDDLLAEVKKARQRANNVEHSKDTIGAKLTALIMAPFNTVT